MRDPFWLEDLCAHLPWGGHIARPRGRWQSPARIGFRPGSRARRQ